MQRGWLIAIIAGLVSALLFTSMLAGNVLSLMLIYLAPLPIVIAGLGWGPTIGVLAALSGSLIMTLTLGLAGAAVFALFYAAPPVLLTRLALRPSERAPQTDAGLAPDPLDPTHWFPVGRLVTWIAAMAVGLFLAIHMVLAGPEGGLVPLIERQLPDMVPDPEALLAQLEEAGTTLTRDELFTFMARLIPGIVALLWCAVMALNLALGQAVVRISGRAIRADFDWLRLELPFGLALALAGALLIGLMPDGAGFVGTTAAVILAGPYFLTGLLTAHGVSAALVARSDTPGLAGGLRISGLAMIYVMLLILQGVAAQLVSLLGILDQWFGFRRRFLDRPAPEENA